VCEIKQLELGFDCAHQSFRCHRDLCLPAGFVKHVCMKLGPGSDQVIVLQLPNGLRKGAPPLDLGVGCIGRDIRDAAFELHVALSQVLFDNLLVKAFIVLARLNKLDIILSKWISMLALDYVSKPHLGHVYGDVMKP
jgi:hypothetical protein